MNSSSSRTVMVDFLHEKKEEKRGTEQNMSIAS
jgi:hypothetical protein